MEEVELEKSSVIKILTKVLLEYFQIKCGKIQILEEIFIFEISNLEPNLS